YFLRSLTTSSAVLRSSALRRSTLGRSITRHRLGDASLLPARRPVSRRMLLEGRILGAAAAYGKRAARREDAPGRNVLEGRHHARDFHEPLAPLDVERGLVEPRHRLHEAERIGVKRSLEQRLDRGFLDLAAGIHDDDAL